ncbi:MAG: EamA family transporter [Chloroflexota bacterium]
MAWFSFAIIATLLMTLVNFGDKFIIESQIPNPLAVLVFFSFFNLFTGALLWMLTGIAFLPQEQAGLLIIAGTAPAFAGYFYFQAVSQAETSRIIIIGQLYPVFTLLLSVLFGTDTISLMQLVGFGLILFAALAATIQRTDTENKEPAAPMWNVFWLLVMTNLIAASSIVLTDNVVNELVVDIRGLMQVTAYMGFGYWLGGMALLIFVSRVRRAFISHLRKLNRGAVASLASVESIFILRQIFLLQALTLGPVAIVSVIGSLNVFFAVILGWVLTLWRPSVFKEDIRRQTLTRKFIWAAVAFVGILLVR